VAEQGKAGGDERRPANLAAPERVRQFACASEGADKLSTEPLVPSRLARRTRRTLSTETPAPLAWCTDVVVAGTLTVESEVASRGLLGLDRLEQGLEVAFAESFATLALDDLEEQGRTVADGTREDLQQVAVVVAVDEDVQ
jgi:hypothetical protein